MRPPDRLLRASLALLSTCMLTCGTQGHHAVTGTVSGSVTEGVAVALGGDGVATTTTDAAGRFGFTGLKDGSYTVTPSRGGHAFYPAHRSVVVTGADARGQDFVASPPHALSGMVSGSASAGVVVSLFEPVEGAYFTETTTDASGRYILTGLADGYYGVVPAAEGLVFVPSLLYATLSGSDLEGQDFVASVPSSISGAVTGAILAGVYVVLSSDASGWWGDTVMATDAYGHYAISGLPPGDYVVTPFLSGYTFDPSSTALTLSGADVGGVDFVAALAPPPLDVAPPSVPGNLSVTCWCGVPPRQSLPVTMVKVAWSPSEDTESGVCGYRVYRRYPLPASSAYDLVAQVGGGAKSWSGKGLCEYYKVSAVDCAGNESGQSREARSVGLGCFGL